MLGLQRHEVTVDVDRLVRCHRALPKQLDEAGAESKCIAAFRLLWLVVYAVEIILLHMRKILLPDVSVVME